MIKLAYALLMQDELDDAHDYYERVLEIRQRTLGRDDRYSDLESLICMGYVLRCKVNLTTLGAYYEEVRELGSKRSAQITVICWIR